MNQPPASDTPALFSLAPVPGRFVNPRCIVHEQDGLRVAMVDGSPFHTWQTGDVFGENLFVVQARVADIATIDELAAALERSRRSLFLAWSQFSKGGPASLVPKARGAIAGSTHDPLRDATIRRLHAGGLSVRAIAIRLATAPLTVTRALKRMGLESNNRRQKGLIPEPTPEAAGETLPSPTGDPEPAEEPAAARDASDPAVPPEEPVVTSMDMNPLDRSLDRFLASQGALEDAAPLFAPGKDLPYLGILLAVPGLVQSGLLPEARRLYGQIGPAFYGLRTSLVVIVLLSLLRLKRPEHLKEFAPPDLGRVLGLDRVPEVKTLRRKLHRLAKGPCEELLLAVSRRRAQAAEEALAWHYVDGHVRVYSGKERIPKAHVTRLRTCLPASEDVWVHDGDGRPILFVTQEAHPSLATALRPILEATREVTGRRPVTLVFDRGGWSPALFAELVKDGADVLTYRKGASDPVPVGDFRPYAGRPGEPEWLLHECSVRLPGGLWMRQITRLVGQHQTAIVTTRQDLPPEVLARRMFDRWRQENFFKYMRQEFDIDGLVEYGSEVDDPERDTPNPEWTRRDAAVKRARDHHRAALAREVDREHPNVRETAAQLEELRAQRDAVPRRIVAGELERPTARLPARVKNFYDGLKSLAWQIETDLFHAVSPVYRRSEDEGRTLITTALRSKGSLELKDGELIVTVAPQSSPHRTRAIAELCAILDRTGTRFPGTALQLRYRVEGDPPEPSPPLASAN